MADEKLSRQKKPFQVLHRKTCIESGCEQLTEGKSVRCPEHKKAERKRIQTAGNARRAADGAWLSARREADRVSYAAKKAGKKKRTCKYCGSENVATTGIAVCAECTKKNHDRYKAEYMAEYRVEKANEISESHAQWLSNNAEHVREYNRQNNHERYERDPEPWLTSAKKRYADAPEPWRQRVKENKEKRLEADREGERAKVAARSRKRRQNLTVLVNGRMSNRIWKALKGKGGKKKPWLAYVDYTVPQLWARLESTLPVGYIIADLMNGRLEIDHIRPVWTFTFTSPEDPEFRECWALTNLQLLTKAAHREKTARDLVTWAAFREAA